MNKIEKEQIIQIIIEIEKEYKMNPQIDRFHFYLNYFFPVINTRSDYVTDNKNRYLCFCRFQPTGKSTAKEKLITLSEYFGMKQYNDLKLYTFGQEFSAYLDVHSMSIPNTCKDEEYEPHITFYGEDSDYYYVPVKTSLALKDEDFLSTIKKNKIEQIDLINKILQIDNLNP